MWPKLWVMSLLEWTFFADVITFKSKKGFLLMQVFRVWKWCNLILVDKGYFNIIRSSLLHFCWIARLSFSVVFSSILRYSQVTVIGTNREQLRYFFQSWLYARSIAVFIVSLYKSLFKHTGQGIYELENSSRTWTNFEWWQWCWWHRYLGDFMMVTDLRCWWQNHYVDDFFFVMLVIFSMY